MSAVAARREAIAAAIETYNHHHPEAPLPRPAARLLTVMFSSDDVCRQSLEALVAKGFTKKTLPGMLRAVDQVQGVTLAVRRRDWATFHRWRSLYSAPPWCWATWRTNSGIPGIAA